MELPDLEIVVPDSTPVQGDNGVPAEVGQPAQQELSDAQKDGIQKRINQLTARLYEKDNTIQQLTEQMVRLAGQAQQPGQVTPPPEENLYEGLDPAAAQVLKRLETKLEQNFQARVAQLEGTIISRDAVTAAKSQGLPDAIVQRSQALMTAWKQKGLPFVPQDAVDFAVGEAIRAGTFVPKPRVANGQFAPVDPVLAGQSGPAPVVRKMKPLPTNFDSLTPTQQVMELEARGIDGEPL